MFTILVCWCNMTKINEQTMHQIKQKINCTNELIVQLTSSRGLKSEYQMKMSDASFRTGAYIDQLKEVLEAFEVLARSLLVNKALSQRTTQSWSSNSNDNKWTKNLDVKDVVEKLNSSGFASFSLMNVAADELSDLELAKVKVTKKDK